MKNKSIILIFFITLILCNKFSFAEDKIYQPYPIVLVSGIGTSDNPKDKNYPGNGTWSYLLSQYKTYFFNGTDSKYIYETKNLLDKELPHLEFLPYNGRDDAITNDADLLYNKIQSVLKRYYTDDYSYTFPCNKPKVILVCHSMGGLIAREMIRKHSDVTKKDYICDKIAFIIFIGTPHLGSPLANFGYFLTKEEPQLTQIENVAKKLYSLSNGEDKGIYANLVLRIRSKKHGNEKFVKWIRDTLNIEPGGDALKDMRIPFADANKYTHSIVSSFPTNESIFHKKFSINETLSYDETKTFLYGLKNNQGKALGIPESNIFSIIGTDVRLRDGLYGVAFIDLGFNFIDNDYSCVANGYYNDGDGAVNLISQKYMVSYNNKEEIYRSHASVSIPILDVLMPFVGNPYRGEYDYTLTPDIILKKIDQKPIISSLKVYSNSHDATSSNLSINILSKLNDYLLADVKLTAMLFDTNDIRPEDFRTSDSEYYAEYKPYASKILEKKFLKQRSDDPNIKDKNGNNLVLMPGEFYVPITLTDSNPHTLILKIKNPAGEEAEASIVIQRPEIDNIYISETQSHENIINKRPKITATIWTASTEIFENADKVSSEGAPFVEGRNVSLNNESITVLLVGPKGPVQLDISKNPISKIGINIIAIPTSDLTPGTYTVKVNGSDMWGLPAQEKVWTFKIPGEQPPIILDEKPTGLVEDTQRPTISAKAYSPDGIPIDLNSISLSVDGCGEGFEVSPATGGSNISIARYPQQNLDYKEHNVSLNLKDTAGQSASKSWSFTIKNPNAFFEVSLPGTISRDTDFTMTVTAKNPDGTPLNTYNEPAAITISGDPNPTGEIFIKRINSNEWQDGTWTTNLQRYINGNESKYKLTITVEGLGSTYPNIKGSADTLVEPLYLTCENIGWYYINEDTGLWEGPFGGEESGWPVSVLKWEAYYRYSDLYDPISKTWIRPGEKKYSGQAEIYKIQIPENSNINKIILYLSPNTKLLTFPPQGSEPFPVTSIYREAWFTSASASSYPPYPKDIMAYYKLDIHQTSPFSKANPGGEENLYNYSVGGMKYNCHGTDHNVGGSMVLSSYTTNWLSIDRFQYGLEIYVEPNSRVIYFTFYPDNFLELADSYYKNFESTNSYSCELTLNAELNIGLVAGIK